MVQSLIIGSARDGVLALCKELGYKQDDYKMGRYRFNVRVV